MSATASQLEDWLRHMEDQLVKLGNGTVKQYTPFRESLEGKDFEGNERKFTEGGAPILANNEGPNHK